jgi:hypothetical protein
MKEKGISQPDRKSKLDTHTQKSSTSIRHPFDIEKNREESGSVVVRSAPGVRRKVGRSRKVMNVVVISSRNAKVCDDDE